MKKISYNGLQLKNSYKKEVFNDDEIVQSVVDHQSKENDGENAEENKVEEEERISLAEGKAALQLASTYIEQQKEATTVDIMLIKKL